ncbi:hypothetical protein FB565_000100 [Actinoplanes lutulentus]|uniref:ThiS family protein n=1 Tax=Actinoplanes lutulentus TaxID=1287878 RepID=A0A327Z1A3_9ACTN|nr:MoaD/ThiS family protein [Actinoplanes lutulentus]MBB2940396.1 hypothetical protein [Actinoplanes lutulentus]RAK25871.1 hypothetical protein B0I29_13080 [Actinoplanes lutulentus]
MLTVDIVEEATTGRPPERWRLELPSERLTLRELIRRRAAAEPEQAITSFARNGFVVLVGDRQIEDLDEMIELRPGAEVTFLRLIPLAGG